MIVNIEKKLEEKKKMDEIAKEYGGGVILTENNSFKTLFGKTVYPLAIIANRFLQSGQSTCKLACGGYVNLTKEEWCGEWYDRLMPAPKNYKEPTLSELSGAPLAAYQMLVKNNE